MHFSNTTLTHPHLCVSKLTVVEADDGLSLARHQAIIWISAEILLIGHLRTNFSEIWIEIFIFSFKKTHLKMSSGKSRPFCIGLNMLTNVVVFLRYMIGQASQLIYRIKLGSWFVYPKSFYRVWTFIMIFFHVPIKFKSILLNHP